jgi:two-component system sensor histidine kinase KdpD
MGRMKLSFDFGRGAEELSIVLSSDEPPRHEVAADINAPPALPRPAREANQNLRIAHYIAHELRSPLGTILGFAGILRKRLQSLSLEDRHMAVHSIESEAERALLTLESLLRLAGLAQGNQPKLSSVPLHAVLRQVIAQHQRRNPERTLILSGDVPLYANADSSWLELAVANLLNNAEKYAPSDTPIEISMRQHGNWATILVLDDGIGLPPERYPLLWNIYREGPDPRVVLSGSGIGLSLCKEMIETMGGRVWAGARPNRGSAFGISLPIPHDMALLTSRPC